MRKTYESISIVATLAIIIFNYNYIKDIVKEGSTAAFISVMLTIVILAICYWLYIGVKFMSLYIVELVKFILLNRR